MIHTVFVLTSNVFYLAFYLTACKKGSFGESCSERCGNCRDEDQCSIVNGRCLTGCTAGYQADLCKTREFKITIAITYFIYVLQ